MSEKLGELEAERAELEKYNQADRTRRALQFTLWDADLTETQASLEQASLSGTLRQAIAVLLEKDMRLLHSFFVGCPQYSEPFASQFLTYVRRAFFRLVCRQRSTPKQQQWAHDVKRLLSLL